jgi:hypothetical protein
MNWRIVLFNAQHLAPQVRRQLEERFQEALEEYFGTAAALDEVVKQYLENRLVHLATGRDMDSGPALLLDNAEEAVEARVWHGVSKPSIAVFDFEFETTPVASPITPSRVH